MGHPSRVDDRGYESWQVLYGHWSVCSLRHYHLYAANSSTIQSIPSEYVCEFSLSAMAVHFTTNILALSDIVFHNTHIGEYTIVFHSEFQTFWRIILGDSYMIYQGWSLKCTNMAGCFLLIKLTLYSLPTIHIVIVFWKFCLMGLTYRAVHLKSIFQVFHETMNNITHRNWHRYTRITVQWKKIYKNKN